MQFRKRNISLHYLEIKMLAARKGATKKRNSYAISCSSLISYIHVCYVLMPIIKCESDRQRKLLNGNLFLKEVLILPYTFFKIFQSLLQFNIVNPF